MIISLAACGIDMPTAEKKLNQKPITYFSEVHQEHKDRDLKACREISVRQARSKQSTGNTITKTLDIINFGVFAAILPPPTQSYSKPYEAPLKLVNKCMKERGYTLKEIE